MKLEERDDAETLRQNLAGGVPLIAVAGTHIEP